MTPTISVIMSVYNAEKFLPQAIESILNQTFKDFEFIIIEDCSTDESLKIIEKYAQQDKRIKLLKKDKNKGVKGFIENLNWGLKEAKGKYIARMDADDISHHNRFQRQYDFLENNQYCFMIGSSINLINENNIFIKKLQAPQSNNQISKQMPIKIAVYHPVIMFRNESNIRYREKALYCEDYDLYLRLINLNKKFYNFPEPLLDYRLLKSSISRKDNNFKRTLFVEKMKQFFYEMKVKGKDSYHEFSPDTFLNIYNNDCKLSKEDLIFSLKVATKFGYKKDFDRLLVNYKSLYSKNFAIYLLQILNSLPNIFKRAFFKLINIS